MTPPRPIDQGLTSSSVVAVEAAAAISIYRVAVLFFDAYPQSGCLHGIAVTQLYTVM